MGRADKCEAVGKLKTHRPLKPVGRKNTMLCDDTVRMMAFLRAQGVAVKLLVAAGGASKSVTYARMHLLVNLVEVHFKKKLSARSIKRYIAKAVLHDDPSSLIFNLHDYREEKMNTPKSLLSKSLYQKEVAAQVHASDNSSGKLSGFSVIIVVRCALLVLRPGRGGRTNSSFLSGIVVTIGDNKAPFSFVFYECLVSTSVDVALVTADRGEIKADTVAADDGGAVGSATRDAALHGEAGAEEEVTQRTQAEEEARDAMELEKELVAALRALELREVPEDMVVSLFNSGGTVVVTTSATGETASAGDPLFPDIVDNVSVNQLRSVDRAFTKYLHKHLAALEENQEATRNVSVGDDSVATEPEVARLWEFFASEEAITAMVGDENERTHSTAAYRTFFTLLHSVINIRDMYARLDDDEKRRALAKALLASKVYLTWLQIPGGSAYGLFMPYVYRQVLDVLKKWIAMMRDDAITRAKENGMLTTRRVSVRQRTLKEKQIAARRRDNEDFTEIQQKLAKFGLDLFGMMATFLSNFSLASSTESIIPTIEMVIVLQTAIPDDDLGEAVSEKSLKVISKLLNDVHGNPIHIARVVAHCYIPGITLQEPLAIENRCALRFHRLAIDIMARTERIIRASAVNVDDDIEREETEHQISLLRLGLLQNICLKAPERSEERQRVLAYAFSIAVSGDAEHQSTRSGFQEEERVRLARFLTSFSRNVNAKFRQFAVELIGKFVLQPEFWQTSENVSHELIAFSGVGPLLDVLIDRSRDKISTVRAKAIAGISSALTLGLSSMPLHSEAKEADSDDGDDDAMDGGAQGKQDGDGSQLIALSLQKLLYSRTAGLDGKKTMEETPLMRRLIELFRESLSDEKTFVRKAAVQALEALLVVRPGPIRKSMRKDLVDIHSKCTDSSLSVRVQAIKSLSAILLKFPQDVEVQKLWNLGILPLCADPEASVQASSLEWTNRLIFERILSWYDTRKSRAQRESLSSVWNLVGHLDGVMIKCVQKSLRILIKEDKVEMKKILRACIYAIKECVSSAVTNATSEGSDASLTRFWDFSWVVLEELAHTGKLVESSNVDKQSLDVVVGCWNRLQQQELPVEFNNGSKRILRVVAALSPVIDARDSKVIADGILASLHAFTIPLNVIADAVLALNSISKAKATSKESRRDVSFGWGKKLLDLCETNLRLCFENDPQRVAGETLLIQKQLICIGEVALLEFNKNDDKSRDPAEVALLPVSSGLASLVQMFLLPQIAANQLSSTQAEPQEEEEEPENPVESTDIPTPVRVCAFVTLGKLCLRDQELAKDCITMLIRELRTCKIQDIRSNILLILGDLCIRYTSLVDAYIPTIALSLLDDSPLIRRSALLLFSQLILQDYIKWRESLLRFFIRAVVDEDEELANLARHVLCGPLRQKSPHLFSNKFIEMIFVFNNYQGRVNFTLDRDGVDEIALPGNARFPQRFQLYRFLLQNMSDEQKLQISMKLCNEVLEEVTDGKLPLCKNPSQITDNGTEAVLKDTFAILCSSDIKLSSSKDGDDDVDGEEGVDANADPSSATNSGNVATQLAAAKGKLLSKMSKKNFLENVVPVLIGLKHKLESKRSPLMRYLQHYFHELFKLYRQEVKDILSADPQMAMEVEYDMRQFELHHKKQLEQQQQQLHNRASQQQPSVAAANAVPATPPKTPPSPSHLPTTTPYNMLDVSETPMEPPDSAVRLREEVNGANAKKIAARRRRRRRSLPPVESPLRVLEKRTTVAQDEEEAEELGGGGEPSVMLFSPNKDVPGSGGKKGGGWQVVVKSPAVSKKSKGKKEKKGDGKKAGGSKAFTQEDLEQSMQQELDEEDADHDAPSSSESSAEQETARKKQSKPKAKAKAKAKQAVEEDTRESQDEAERDEEEEEFMQLPLKKKSKKKAEKPVVPAKKKKSKGDEDGKRAKRKRD